MLARLWRKFVLAPAGRGHPIPAAAADREYASGAWDHFESAAESARYAAVAAVIARLHPTGAVLDLGCGPGRLADLLRMTPPRRYLGVDFSAEAVARARRRGLPGCEFAQGDFETWRAAEPFAAIVFNEAVGYSRDPRALLAAFAPALKADGHLVVSHFRSAHWPALWRRLESAFTVVEAHVVANATGQTWDVKALRPRPPAA
ncbi:MAG: hypothetical protein RLZZ15_4083 [Verrucomicrobiota bacterium]|jgi:trans-aconitate methyltransferase